MDGTEPPSAREPRGTMSGVAGPDVLHDPDYLLWLQLAEGATDEAFHRAWLALQCRMIPGVANGVLVLAEKQAGVFAPAATWPDGRRTLRHLAEAAERALKEGRNLILRAPLRDDEGTRPCYSIAALIRKDAQLHGVVAVDVTPRTERDLLSALRQLEWGAAWLELRALRGQTARSTRVQTVFDLVVAAFGHQRFSAAATAFVTTIATRLGCERVSLGFMKRGRARVAAVSHTAKFNRRANLVRAIEQAMDEAIDQQETLVWPPPPDGRPQVTRAHAELGRAHAAGAACTAPLVDSGRVIGAITLERPVGESFDTPVAEMVEALAALAGPILERTRREDRWIATKITESALGLIGRLVGPRHLGLKAAVAIATAVVLFFAFATGDFRVSASTTLEPLVRQALVAPFNGYVARAPARAGDTMRRGQVLATLDDRDLRLSRAKWASQEEQLLRQYQQAMALRNAAQVVILTAQLDQVRAEMALVDDQLKRTNITAPFDGVVVTGDLSQSLSAPVERGQVLFEVAPPAAYRVVLQVDERDITYVAERQRGTLLLTGAPTEPLSLTVDKITPVSTAREGRNYFRVEATLEGAADALRPGMEGVGKVEIDRRLLAWIWTRQVVDWIRLQLWTWLP